MASRNLTDNQRMIAKTMDIASQLVVDYAAPEVPEMGNLTPTGLCEMFGRLNEARKQLEKVEKIVRARFESQIPNQREFRGENFVYKKASQERTALDQTMAKETLARMGEEVLAEHMKTTEVDTVTIKRI
jgi:hypothetical protein